MQMYKVNYHSQRGNMIEIGALIVCAADGDDAIQRASGFVGVSPSMASFEAARVKPSVYELSRRDFTKRGPKKQNDSQEAPEQGAVHEVSASAKVFGYSEGSVLRRFAEAIKSNASANSDTPPSHINELNIDVERADERPAPSRVDEQSIYKETRFFPGGAARPR
tara:strand:+ start:321 stop:815 length:495 start_codon:yes stop_codon:yes gene_type:complete